MINAPFIDEILPDPLEGERLDRVVAMLDGCSRSAAATMIAAGDVAVDGKAVTQRSMRVSAGQRVSFAATEEQVITLDADPDVEFEVVFADDDVIVVNKPVGLIVHPGAGRPDETLVNGLLARFPEIDEVGQVGRPGIVHRLDGETSGLLVVARTAAAYDVLTAAMARHDVVRVYAAAVNGIVSDDRGVIDAPIGRSTQRRTRMAVLPDGRDARTHYEVRSRNYEEPAASYLRCQLETGRTHQIRVHLSAIGHAVLGDPTYGDRTSRDGFSRVALHAEHLGFEHPITGQEVSFDAPLPADLQELVDERFS
ncbi:MAG: 23S rRNA pseudouridine1911/1915/1917 synthase [Acidimicrobiales bacterium]|jgi:23S rRNA pseudouridine1911/1915/1917 synthase